MQTIDADKQAQILRMIETDTEFRQLHEEHQDLHRQIEEIMKRRHLAPEEEATLAELKKRKLAAKDAMGRMLFDDEHHRRPQ
jgi:uncharacterized protein YdcH (DUF465 family)